MDEAWTATFMFFIFGWCCFFIQGDRDYTVRQQAINNATYRYAQVVSKKGELSPIIDSEITDTFKIYGDYEVTYQAEKFDGDTLTKLKGTDVIGRDLRAEGFDIIKIHVVSNKNHYLTSLFKMSPMGKADVPYKIAAQSSAYIQ